MKTLSIYTIMNLLENQCDMRGKEFIIGLVLGMVISVYLCDHKNHRKSESQSIKVVEIKKIVSDFIKDNGILKDDCDKVADDLVSGRVEQANDNYNGIKNSKRYVLN